MIAKLREQSGDPCAKSLIRDLLAEARRLGVEPPDWMTDESPHRFPCIQVRRYRNKDVVGYKLAIKEASMNYGLPAELIIAVILAESMFDREAISAKGAIGLMQLMPATARQLGIKDPFDPYANIMGGAYLLRKYLLEFGSLKRALAAYNAGPSWIRAKRRLPAETQTYVRRVIRYYRMLRQKKIEAPHSH